MTNAVSPQSFVACGSAPAFMSVLTRSSPAFARGQHKAASNRWATAHRPTRPADEVAREFAGGHFFEHRVAQRAPIGCLRGRARHRRSSSHSTASVCPVSCRQLQGLFAVAVGAPRIGATLDEQRHHVDAAVPNSRSSNRCRTGRPRTPDRALRRTRRARARRWRARPSS